MKKYVTPEMTFLELRSEENIATGSPGCTEGYCNLEDNALCSGRFVGFSGS